MQSDLASSKAFLTASRSLFRLASRPFCWALPKEETTKVAKMPAMAMVIRSSINVNPLRLLIVNCELLNVREALGINLRVGRVDFVCQGR